MAQGLRRMAKDGVFLVLRFFLFSAFRIFSRGIVPPYRTTTGPTSEFLKPLYETTPFITKM